MLSRATSVASLPVLSLGEEGYAAFRIPGVVHVPSSHNDLASSSVG